MAESIDWWIIPVLDVDGFVYTYEKKSSWLKSNPDFFDACRSSNYSRKPTKPNPHFDQCNGPQVTFESTPEIELLKKFIDTNLPKDYIKIYIGLHSGVQAVLTPCNNMEEFPPNYNQLMFVAKAFVDALFPRFHTQYSYGTSANILNWAYAEKGIPIALGIGLPKDRAMPFQLPKRAILRLSKELLDGFIGLIKAVKELGHI
ncbi:zinc carboxypeptidase-like [Glossina fuscipes]|uniref:Zinc carboxypeptidase-like n=1 Tax=Glossina fuscipes TaxID=7396 RepID=A0A8U0WA28_9MUSC|nr:zinc carboxypeptidase-like [Glossina fuscipes]